MNKNTIYVDMDRVLVDFELGVKEMTGILIDKKTQGQAFINKLIQRVGETGGPTFWSELKWMDDGQNLWFSVNALAKERGMNVAILSSPGTQRGPLFEKNSKTGKTIWVKRELGPNVKLILELDKKKYAKPGNILIDDYDKNTISFENAGGEAILHRTTFRTISELTKKLNRMDTQKTNNY